MPPSCDAKWHDLQTGTEQDDEVWGMAADEQGNIYVSGFEHGVTGVTNIEPDGNSQGVVIQFDSTGVQKWKAVLDTGATDTIEDVAIEPTSGRVFAVGRTSGAFDGFINQGQFDTVLVALDAKGQTTKIFQTGDERPQHPARLSLGSNHEIAVAGYDDTYIPTNYVESWEDGFIASFDRGATEPAFTQNFLQKVPLTPPNRITGVAIDRDGSGNMYVTSRVTGPRASVGIYVKKLTSTGAVLWSTRITNLSADAVNAVGLSPANELFVTGATFLSLSGTNAGQQDAYVLKLDKATGNLIWAAQAGSTESDYPTAMAFDAAGNIYIAGETFGSVVAGASSHGGMDVFAMKFDPAGALLSSWQTGSIEDDSTTSMVVDRCGKVLVGGFTKGAMVDGSTGTAGNEMFVVQAAL